jgi:hypothetical protein
MTYPHETKIRSSLIDRTREFTRLTGMSISAVCREAVKDTSFIKEVERGLNFTVGKYQRVHSWLDKNWPNH